MTVESPAHARRLGIGMVFQHFSLFEKLTVAENVALGVDEPSERANLRERIAETSRDYGLPLDPEREVHDLSVGERQRIEIVRCLLQNPKLLIMDEPTSVLTPQEAETAVHDAAPARRRGLRHPLHQPQARGDPRAVRHRDDHAPRQGSSPMQSARRKRPGARRA